jgi:hypothetical protein
MATIKKERTTNVGKNTGVRGRKAPTLLVEMDASPATKEIRMDSPHKTKNRTTLRLCCTTHGHRSEGV